MSAARLRLCLSLANFGILANLFAPGAHVARTSIAADGGFRRLRWSLDGLNTDPVVDDQVDDRPVIFALLQMIQRQFGQLTTTQPTPE